MRRREDSEYHALTTVERWAFSKLVTALELVSLLPFCNRLHKDTMEPLRGLLSLPDELLDRVCLHNRDKLGADPFTFPQSSAKEHPFHGVSRRLHTIALPHKYAQVKLNAQRFPLFVRTIVERTELGLWVQDMEVEYSDEGVPHGAEMYGNAEDDNDGGRNEEEDESDEAHHEQDVARDDESKPHPATIIRAAEVIDPVLSRFMKTVPSSQSALLVLLLWYLPQLRSLQLAVSHYPRKCFFDTCYFALPDSPSPEKLPLGLRTVEKVKLRCDAEDLYMEDTGILPVMFLPSLKRLMVCMVYSEGWHGSTLPLLHRLRGQCKLPELDFEAAELHSRALSALFTLVDPDSFKRFTYILGSAVVQRTEFDGYVFADVLAPVHATLETLELAEWDGAWDDGGDYFTVPRLQTLTGLKELYIKAKMLSDWSEDHSLLDLLPPNIRTLHIDGGFLLWTEEDMEEPSTISDLKLFDAIKGLKYLKILGLYARPGSVAPKWLRSCCEAAGVVINIVRA